MANFVNKFKIGQRVVADSMAKAQGTIIGFYTDPFDKWESVIVEFDEPIAKNTIHQTIIGKYHPHAVWPQT